MNECNIVRDLLPLYADDLASVDSVEFIDRHTANCPRCLEIWRRYRGELPRTHPPIPEQRAEDYRKPLKRDRRKLFLMDLLSWLLVLGLVGYLVWEGGWLGPEKAIQSPDGGVQFRVKDYANAGFFNKGGVYVVTPDGQGRDLKDDKTFVDLNIWFSPDGEAYLVWWEFTDHDEVYIIDSDVVNEIGWLDYKQMRDYYSENLFNDLTVMLRDAGELVGQWENVRFEPDEWSEDGHSIRFRYETDNGMTGYLWYSIKTESITEVQ